MPLVHARDAAEAKVAAIGTVNPRRGGLANAIVQRVKRLISRALDWHVREQVEFNRASMACVQASIEALNDVSRAMAALASHHAAIVSQQQALRGNLEDYHREADELKDVRRHWSEWRVGFEERRAASEIHMLRSISELQGAFQHRVTLLEQNFRQLAGQQHREFSEELARNTLDVQKRLWEDLQKIRAEHERLIHTELRLLRQKTAPALPAHTAAAPETPAPVPQIAIPIDWQRFAETFRGSGEHIRGQQDRYVRRFADAVGEILDIGCGRGEFLQAARDAGLSARGIDANEECVALCRSRGLDAICADMFVYLESCGDRSLGGAYCSQVIEHLPPAELPGLINLLAAKLRPTGVAIFETPNPECLAIFATHFYIDPTHTRPVPSVLLRFYLEEAGFGGVEIEYLSPASDSMPAVAELPEAFRNTFFGGLDYALIARKL